MAPTGPCFARWSSYILVLTTDSYNATGEHNDEALGSWRWIQEHDELLEAMRGNGILGGFTEAPIRFPPSYRWNREAGEAVMKDFTHTSDLEKGYCLNVKRVDDDGNNQGKDLRAMRTPSYTDRILTYSQSDRQSHLHWRHYDLCEGVLGSDHRPVYAILDLEVDGGVIGFTPVMEPVGRFWEVGDMKVENCIMETSSPPQDYPHHAIEMSNLDNELYDGRPCAVTIELGDMAFDFQGGRDETEVDQVVVLYPLVAEDPFSHQRTAWWFFSVSFPFDGSDGSITLPHHLTILGSANITVVSQLIGQMTSSVPKGLQTIRIRRRRWSRRILKLKFLSR